MSTRYRGSSCGSGGASTASCARRTCKAGGQVGLPEDRARNAHRVLILYAPFREDRPPRHLTFSLRADAAPKDA
jgi:hypothetical protein